MTEQEILNYFDIPSLCVPGVYWLPTLSGHVDGSQGYSWEKERYFILSDFGSEIATCFRHCGDGAGCFEVAEWSIESPFRTFRLRK